MEINLTIGLDCTGTNDDYRNERYLEAVRVAIRSKYRAAQVSVSFVESGGRCDVTDDPLDKVRDDVLHISNEIWESNSYMLDRNGLTKEGVRFVEDWLKRRAKKPEHFDVHAMVDHKCCVTEAHGDLTLEIKSHQAISGHTETLTLRREHFVWEIFETD